MLCVRIHRLVSMRLPPLLHRLKLCYVIPLGKRDSQKNSGSIVIVIFYRLFCTNCFFLFFFFRFCDLIDPGHTDTKDIANIHETLASNFAGVVQYNKDNRRSSKTANITIDTICDILVNETRGTPVSRLAEMSNMLLNANGEKCFDYKYSKMIEELRNVSWNDEAAEGGSFMTYKQSIKILPMANQSVGQ